MGAMIKLLPQA